VLYNNKIFFLSIIYCLVSLNVSGMKKHNVSEIILRLSAEEHQPPTPQKNPNKPPKKVCFRLAVALQRLDFEMFYASIDN
jgi:hypothetical protein